jgi:hypothetical protein
LKLFANKKGNAIIEAIEAITIIKLVQHRTTVDRHMANSDWTQVGLNMKRQLTVTWLTLGTGGAPDV